MTSQCPTCHRQSIVCAHCGRLATDDSEGRLPRWCSGCGAMLTEPTRASRHETLLFAANDLGHTLISGRVRVRTLLLAFAVTCGLLASLFTYGLSLPPKETPAGPRIYRPNYSVQLPEKEWKFEPNRWELDGADLVEEATFRGGKGMLLMVHVIHSRAEPLTLDALIDQTRQQWLDQMPECVFLPDEGGQTAVAGQKAARLIAISHPDPQSGWERRFKGDPIRREAVMLICDGVGYRLTAEEFDTCFDRVTQRFERFVASFAVRPAH